MASHHDVTDYKPGEMDITAQRKTFDGFVKAVTWGTVISVVILIFMALVNA